MRILPALDFGGTVDIINSIWLIVEDPGNNGLPNNNSAKMQPILHISTPFWYLKRNSFYTKLYEKIKIRIKGFYIFDATRISGALYHLVAI